jgi:LytS/YehU family sensor histidine kinase
MRDRRSFPRLLGIAIMIVTLWQMFALFSASEIYRRNVDSGYVPRSSWYEILAVQHIGGFVWAFFTPIIAFIAERIPLAKPVRWRNTLVLLALTPLLAVVRAVGGGVILPIAENADLRGIFQMAVHSIAVRFHRNVFLILVIVGIVNLVLAYRASAARQREGLAAKKEAANAELQRMRLALQPHFLFNTLDAVRGQIHRSPVAADRMLVQFGLVLRKMLEFEKRSDVTLGAELELVRQCTAIEAARTNGLFTTEIAIDNELLDMRLPPLLLHSMVEPALLAEGLTPGQLTIVAWAEDGTLRIVVANSDPSRAPSPAAIEAMRARLQRAFPDRATLETPKPDGSSVIRVTMPLERVEGCET